jgi:hypothetical protein
MFDEQNVKAKKTVFLIVLLSLLHATQLLANKVTKGKDNAQEKVSPGKCSLPDGSVAPGVSTLARLTGSQGEWSVAMETIGSNSVGSWFINFTKNGIGEPSMQYEFNPPGGWSIVGRQVSKDEAKGRYDFIVKATKSANPIIVCEAKISMKKEML